MKRIKITVLFFSISIIFLGYFSSSFAGNELKIGQTVAPKNFSLISSVISSSTSINASDKKGDYVNLLNSLLALVADLKAQVIKLQSAITLKNKADLPKQISAFPAKESISQSKKESVITTTNDYYEKFIKDVASKFSFSDEERNLMEKNNDSEKILSLPELLQRANSGYNLDKLKYSFAVWHKFDEKVISKLKSMPVGGEAFSLNNSLISWLQYHSNTAKKISEESLTTNQINDLYKKFKAKADVQNLFMKNSVAALNNLKNFSIINTAHSALTCAPTSGTANFGGMVYFTLVCDDFSELLIISNPCGGIFQLSVVVEALNPYFKGFVKVSDNILGQAKSVTTSCSLDGVTYANFDASIIYFGASGGL